MDFVPCVENRLGLAALSETQSPLRPPGALPEQWSLVRASGALSNPLEMSQSPISPAEPVGPAAGPAVSSVHPQSPAPPSL